jgi:hypothetical protein
VLEFIAAMRESAKAIPDFQQFGLNGAWCLKQGQGPAAATIS